MPGDGDSDSATPAVTARGQAQEQGSRRCLSINERALYNEELAGNRGRLPAFAAATLVVGIAAERQRSDERSHYD